MSTQIYIYLLTIGWVLTIILLLLYVWNYELRLNIFIPNGSIRRNQVHNLDIENTKENTNSTCYNDETKEDIRISESV